MSAPSQRLSLSSEDYARAERYLPQRVRERVSLGDVEPHWLDEHRFWYLRRTPDEKEFLLVDASQRSRRPAFDHTRLAATLSNAAGEHHRANDLPFDSIAYLEEQQAIEFKIDRTWWRFDLDTNEIERRDRAEATEWELVSPDGKRAALLRDGNLFVRQIETGEERQLTHDAEPYFDYASSPEGRTSAITEAVTGTPCKPVAVWSPDSRRLLTHRLDQREVRSMHLIQATAPEGARPLLHSYRYAIPLDENIPLAFHLVIDVEDGSSVILELGPRPAIFRTPLEWKELWWSEDGRSIEIVEPSRDLRSMRVLRADATSGAVREILREESSTSIYPRATMVTALNVRTLRNGDVVWYSTRDGWGHLYRYDASGRLMTQLTSGEWTVHEILLVDEEHGVLFCVAGGREEGRDPYLRHLYRVALDGSGVTLLTPEDADHAVSFEPSGLYFVDHFSRVDTSPMTLLRSADGEVLMSLEEADISSLIEEGWQPPERFTAKSADGKTDLYGAILRPSTYDPSRSYPLIDHIYPGPQSIRTPKSFDALWNSDAQATAELGCVVVTVDGSGTPYRSRAFMDLAYGEQFGIAGGLADHVAAIKQLGARYSNLNIDRVGIYGLSGGGYASTRAMLTFPDFFKVAVSMAGNHDQRGYIAAWGETYMGLEESNYANQANPDLAANLRGKLLLMHGEMDDNVHPSLTLKLVDALIAANKDFDLLILPNCNHTLFDVRRDRHVMVPGMHNPYATRRLWDYFVQHLLHAEPPAGYRISD